MTIEAIKENIIKNKDYICKHTCIEPFEMPWLKDINSINLLREKVESIDQQIFKTL